MGRRTFTKAYKQRLLTEADACKHGEVGLLLRREGFHHATLAGWRKQTRQGGEEAVSAKQRGRNPAQAAPLKEDNARLTKELTRPLTRLQQMGMINGV